MRTSAALAPLLIVLLVAAAGPVHAQERGNDFPRVSPNASVSQTIGVTDVTVTYGRPSARDRTIFGDLVPYNRVWRTGANEATTITFSTDVTVEGQSLEAGTYALFTIPGREWWTVIFNDVEEQWGAYAYDEAQDVLRVQVRPEESPHQEMMSFHFDDVTDTSGDLVLEWSDVAVPITISTPTQDLVLERGAQRVAETNDWRVPFQYANYALENETGLEDALEWAEKAVELESNYATLQTQARLLARAGRYDDAVRAGEQAVEVAQDMDDPPQSLNDFSQQVEQWRGR